MSPAATVHPVRHPPDAPSPELSGQLVDLGLAGGLAAVGMASAEAFGDTRRVLTDRKARGLHGSMEFTYRNPERSTDPRRILPGARALVVGAWSYRHEGSPGPAPADGARPAGSVARVARHDHYASLRSALHPLAGRLRSEGWRAVVVCDDNALVDRAAAHRAGLGWFGRNTLLLLPGGGSWFVLGSVVTDAPLRPRAGAAPLPPAEHAAGCGTCTRCLRACPTGALVEPGVLDARRCLAWVVQAPGPIPGDLRRPLGDRLYGCDECQVVCPVNRTADRRSPASAPVAAGGDGSRVDLLDLLASSDDQLLERHGRWYIPRRDPRYLRRNALVALGNVGRADDRETVAALTAWAGGGDELLAEHARWALDELGRRGREGGPPAGGRDRPEGHGPCGRHEPCPADR